MSILTINRNKEEIKRATSLLSDKSFYWVKWEPNAEWEIARWSESNGRFRFTNGSYQKIEDAYEIDDKPIVRKK